LELYPCNGRALYPSINKGKAKNNLALIVRL